MISLTEKVEVEREEDKEGKSTTKGDDEMGNVCGVLLNNKIEDRLSSGSGGSAVVDDQDGPQLVDSGDSYFQSDEYHHGCLGVVDAGVQSEEDDGSDDGRSYFSDVLVANDDHHHEEPMGWWVWS